MSTPTSAAEVRPLPPTGAEKLTPQQAAGLAALFAVLGLTTIWSTVGALWALWTTDALKSIGMFIPLVSFLLILRVWRSMHWKMDGSWWGLLVLIVTIAVVHVRDQAVLVFVFSPQWSVYVPPHSLVVFAYASGIVLLFGGTRLYRAALFPILLLWFVNPIPHIFNVMVDLPLQRISAHVARSFAIALGQPLSPDQLRLMFTPNFGMFIAPGCNGIRGAVTMGFIALIAGYLYRFRWYAHAAVVAGAILLGYVFNFARLCTLVLYYLVALHFTWLQHHAEMGDYIIGACLFLVAVFLLFYVIGRLGASPGQIKPPALIAPASSPAAASSLYPRLAAMVVIVLFGFSGVVRAYVHNHSPARMAQILQDQTALGQFPTHIGSYTLSRSWNENLLTGPLIFHWAEYVPADGGPHISLGISPVLGSHDTLICHSARGEDPLWAGQMTIPTAGNVPINFSGSFFNNSSVQYLEATTICNGTACGEYSTDRPHFGFVYSKPDPQSLFTQNPARPIPVLLHAETSNTTLPPDVARQELTTAVGSFLASVDLDGLTQPYRRQ
ncbi:MAG: exosortase J [Edaphobacter sp.]